MNTESLLLPHLHIWDIYTDLIHMYLIEVKGKAIDKTCSHMAISWLLFSRCGMYQEISSLPSPQSSPPGVNMARSSWVIDRWECSGGIQFHVDFHEGLFQALGIIWLALSMLTLTTGTWCAYNPDHGDYMGLCAQTYRQYNIMSKICKWCRNRPSVVTPFVKSVLCDLL